MPWTMDGHINKKKHTFPAGVQRSHVEQLNTLHLGQNLQTLQTSRLLQIGGDGARLGAGTEQVISGADLYKHACC